MTFRYQAFTSPGTWTNPGSVTDVEVTVVGGGGGATPSPLPITLGPGGGGGGAVRTKWVPVSGPVPITVGAGGTGSPSVPTATNGGTSAFGPLGPGPIPAIPTDTVAAGGGAKGGTSVPAPEVPIGGGAGQTWPSTPSTGGLYGMNGDSTTGGSGGRDVFKALNTTYDIGVAIGEGYYGNGGGPSGSAIVYGVPYPAGGAPATACANTGAGGGVNGGPGPNPAPAFTNSPGSAGIVIVRWFE